MKHTTWSLKDTAARFLFAAENNIPEAIASMTQELSDAHEQCKAITGKEWYEFTNDLQDEIHGWTN